MSKHSQVRTSGETEGPFPYDVGYGRPPASGQFSKGRSGNPKGRPKRQTKPEPIALHSADEPTRRLLREEKMRTVTLREGEQRVDMSMTQAVLRAVGTAAVKGGVVAQRTFLAYAAAEDERYRAERQRLYEFWCDERDRMLADLADCQRRGLPEPEFLPDTRDIKLDPLTLEVDFVGAYDDESKAVQNYAIAFRDFALAMSFTHDPDLATLQTHKGIGLWLYLFTRIDRTLPPRLRLSDIEHHQRGMAMFVRRPDEQYEEFCRLSDAAGLPQLPRRSWNRLRPRVVPWDAIGFRLNDSGRPVRIAKRTKAGAI